MIIFRSHMGLGDHIICNAIVRSLSEHDDVIVPVKNHYEISVRYMYSDNPRIRVFPFADDNETNRFCTVMGRKGVKVIWNGNVGNAKRRWEKSRRHWDQRYYEQVGLDFDLRWRNFKFPENAHTADALFHHRFPNSEPRDFIFLHCTSSSGPKEIQRDLVSQERPIYIPDPSFTSNIFDYVELLRRADEIHCINSSFLVLADSLALPGKLHFHASAVDIEFNSPTLKSPWTVHPLP